MAFFEQRLDTRIERGARGGPINDGRTKVYTAAGRLRQNFGWSAPLHKFDVSHGCKSPADFESLRSMWWVVNFNPYDGFRFRDWSDYKATAANSALTLISGSNYQLQRKYVFGGITVKRDLQKPVAGAIVYDAGGTPLTATVDTTTGIAAVTGTPAYWVGEFDVPVTFESNEWMQELEATSAGPLVLTQSIMLEEFRL